MLECSEAEQHVLSLGRIAHRSDAPDLALQRTERGADLDPELFEQPLSHAELVDTVGHDDRRQERQASRRRCAAEQRETERGDAGAQRVAVQAMACEARREPFLVNRA